LKAGLLAECRSGRKKRVAQGWFDRPRFVMAQVVGPGTAGPIHVRFPCGSATLRLLCRLTFARSPALKKKPGF